MSRASVLLIEPDKLLAHTYQMALEAAGFTTQHAATSQAALTCADEQVPGVIVLELQLPAHNGFEFLYELRSYPEWAQIPIVINSFMAPNVLNLIRPEHKTELGIAAALYKPRTSLMQLQRTVREALAFTRATSAADVPMAQER